MNIVIQTLHGFLRKLAAQSVHIIRLPEQTSPANCAADRLQSPHLHDACEIKIALKGSLKCYFPGNALTVRSGGILIIPPGRMHADTKIAHLSKGGQWLNLWFENEALGICVISRSGETMRFLTAEQHAQLSAVLMQSPADLYANLYALSRDNNPLINKGVYGFMYGFFALLIHILSAPVPARRKSAELVALAISHMKIMHYDPRLKIRDVAQAVNRSASCLAHLFKREKKASVRRTLMNIRLDRAYRLLQKGRYTVKEIAYHTGWSNPLYFSGCFRKKYGLPPSRVAAAK